MNSICRRLLLLLLAFILLTPFCATAADSLWVGTWHQTRADGSEVDTLDVGLNNGSTSFAGTTFSVTGPYGFSYTFTTADVNKDYFGQLEMYKFYSTPLAPGFYAFIFNDGKGNISKRIATHVATSRTLPGVNAPPLAASQASNKVTNTPFLAAGYFILNHNCAKCER